MKFTLASPAIAHASNVFPTPGSPKRRTPLCNFAPTCRYFIGSEIILMTLLISSLISSMPFTSESLVVMSSDLMISNSMSILNVDFNFQLRI